MGFNSGFKGLIHSLVRYHRHVYLEMEAAGLFDTMVIVCYISWSHKQEGHTVNFYHHENLKIWQQHYRYVYYLSRVGVLQCYSLIPNNM